MEQEHKVIVSISVIDNALFKEGEDYKYHKKNDLYDSFISYLTKKINSIDSQNNHIRTKEYDVFLYNTGKIVQWKDFIISIFSKLNHNEFSFKTNFPSYLLVKKIENSIYCITAGKSNSVIDKYKNKTFGISLLPKLIEKNDDVIRYISDHRVYGRRNATKLSNRATSSFGFEQNIESIYGEIGLSLKSEIYQKLGIYPIENKDKSTSKKEINVTFSANLRINKQVTLEELDNILNTIHELSVDTTNKPKFAVNLLVPVKKKGIKRSDVTNNFLQSLVNNQKCIELAYNHDLNNEISQYTICNSSGKEISNSEKELCGIYNLEGLDDLKIYIKKMVQIGKSSKNVLQGRKIITDENLTGLKNEYKLFELLEVEYNFNGVPVYLMEGEWYLFLEDYKSFLDKSYKELFDISQSKWSSALASIKLNLKDINNEEGLKAKILSNEILIDADKVCIDNVEIADAIYIRDNEIIFLHNKTSFSGPGVRDLTGQIKTSAQLISKIRNMNYTSIDKLESYISNLHKKNVGNKSLGDKIDKFYRMIKDSNTKITYIAIFVEDVKRNTNSTYIKYLLDTTKHELDMYLYKFYFADKNIFSI